MGEKVSVPLRRVRRAIGADRVAGSRGATFEPEGPVAGTVTQEPTQENIEITQKPTPSKRVRTAEDIAYGRG